MENSTAIRPTSQDTCIIREILMDISYLELNTQRQALHTTVVHQLRNRHLTHWLRSRNCRGGFLSHGTCYGRNPPTRCSKRLVCRLMKKVHHLVLDQDLLLQGRVCFPRNPPVNSHLALKGFRMNSRKTGALLQTMATAFTMFQSRIKLESSRLPSAKKTKGFKQG